jgi:NAD dependent epimerase/dehydratase family enzyme
VLGELSTDVLSSLRAVPTRLTQEGFVHQDGTLAAALASALAS